MDVPSIDHPAIGLPLLPPFWSILGNTLSGNIKVKHTSCTTWTFAQPVARWAMCVARGRRGCSKASAKWGGNWAKPKGCVRTKTIGTKFTGTNVLAYVGRILCFYLSVGCYTGYIPMIFGIISFKAHDNPMFCWFPPPSVNQWIGLRENLQESPIFSGKIDCFLYVSP